MTAGGTAERVSLTAASIDIDSNDARVESLCGGETSTSDDEHFLCDICCETTNTTELRHCCATKTCSACLAEYIEEKLTSGAIRIECISCDRILASHVVVEMLERENRQRAKAEYVRIIRGDKKCPRCSTVLTQFEGSCCPSCRLNWCFRCEATHDGASCDDYKSTHRVQLKVWAKGVSDGQWNAQKCPRCKIYIQKMAGCDHMHCISCKTDFCYRCGGRFRHMKFFGDHYSKLSVFGCKYRYKPNKPVQRKLIRSAVFAGRVLALPVAGVGALCGITALAVLAVPMYAGYHVHKKVSSWTAHRNESKQISPNEQPDAETLNRYDVESL